MLQRQGVCTWPRHHRPRPSLPTIRMHCQTFLYHHQLALCNHLDTAFLASYIALLPLHCPFHTSSYRHSTPRGPATILRVWPSMHQSHHLSRLASRLQALQHSIQKTGNVRDQSGTIRYGPDLSCSLFMVTWPVKCHRGLSYASKHCKATDQGHRATRITSSAWTF